MPNYQIDYWGWISDLTEGYMVLTDGKMVLIEVLIFLRVERFPMKCLVNKRSLMSQRIIIS